jgi:hypothetical protein
VPQIFSLTRITLTEMEFATLRSPYTPRYQLGHRGKLLIEQYFFYRREIVFTPLELENLLTSFSLDGRPEIAI